MSCVNQHCFSISSLSIPWSHDQYSESRFKQQPLAFDKSRILKIWRKESDHGNQLRSSWPARNQISCGKMTISQAHFLSTKNLYLEEHWGKEGENETKPKQNRRLLKTLSQGQLSMECILVFKLPTQAEHQKLGWVSPLFLQAQATVSH